jgi:hypothetical protein
LIVPNTTNVVDVIRDMLEETALNVVSFH